MEGPCLWPVVIVLDGERKIHYSGAPGSFAELTAEALLAEMKLPVNGGESQTLLNRRRGRWPNTSPLPPISAGGFDRLRCSGIHP